MSENTEIKKTSDVNQNTQTDQNVVQNEVTLAPKIESHEEQLKNAHERIIQLENELQKKDTDLLSLNTRVSELTQEITEAQKLKSQHLKETEEIEVLKEKSEDTLTRAKGIIFEKTKVVKNQELQIEALNEQITALKDVVTITKDLLEIRNLEIKQLETKIKCVEDKFGAEKARYDLMHKKLESMIRYNGELKREYETQLCLFSALRERYNERELAKGVLDEARGNVVVATAAVAAARAEDEAANASAGASTSASDEPTSNQASGDVTQNGDNQKKEN